MTRSGDMPVLSQNCIPVDSEMHITQVKPFETLEFQQIEAHGGAGAASP